MSDFPAVKNFRRKCALMKYGAVSYENGLALQARAQSLVASKKWDGVIILLQHTPVITVGNGGGTENVRFSSHELESEGISVVHADRGGNVTCHNPGQLVGYPVLNLAKWQKDVHWYVHMLEEVLILTMAKYGLRTGRKARYTGVWAEDEKIAAIGISVRRWLTRHGFALNIHNNLRIFDSVIPCGITQFGVTNMVARGFDVTMGNVAETYVDEFSRVFQCELQQII